MGLYDNCIEHIEQVIRDEEKNITWHKRMIGEAGARVGRWQTQLKIYQELNQAYEKDHTILSKLVKEVKTLIQHTKDREEALSYAEETAEFLNLSKEIVVDEIERQYNALTDQEAHKNNE